MTAAPLSLRAPIRHNRRSFPALLVTAVLLWTGCVDQATDPNASMTAVLALATIFPEDASSQASFVDAWRVEVSRPGEGVIAEASGAVGPQQQTVDVQVSVTLRATCETLSIRVELSSDGEVWFRSEGNHEVCSGTGNEVQFLELQWVRPQPTVSPGSLLFTLEEGEASNGTFRITYDGTDDLPWIAMVLEGDADWVRIQPPSGSVTAGQPQDVTVAVNTVSLTPGRYIAHVVVTGEGFPAPLGGILVDLTVTRGPRIGLSTASLSFATDEGASPPFQTIVVTNAGGGTLTWSASDDVPWLSLSPTSGSLAPSQSHYLEATVNSESLNPGTYVAAITVTDPNADNSPRIVGVTLNVSQNPQIGLSTTSLSFTTLQGTSPVGQLLTVSNSGGGLLEWQASDDVGWLSVSPTSGILPAGLGQWLTVSINSDGLESGSYLGTITIQDPDASNSPRTISVNLTVNPLVAPALSNLVVTMLQLNDTTCANSGSRFWFRFDYADPDGDILITGDSLTGTPMELFWAFMPAGMSGSFFLTASVLTAGEHGTPFSGTANFQMCIAYQPEINTSINIGFSLVDSGARQSNQLGVNIPRPVGANSPPQASVSPSGGTSEGTGPAGIVPARREGGAPPPLE